MNSCLPWLLTKLILQESSWIFIACNCIKPRRFHVGHVCAQTQKRSRLTNLEHQCLATYEEILKCFVLARCCSPRFPCQQTQCKKLPRDGDSRGYREITSTSMKRGFQVVFVPCVEWTQVRLFGNWRHLAMCPFGVVDRGVIMIQENSRIEAHGLAGSSSPQRGDTLPMTIFLHFFTCFFSGGGGAGRRKNTRSVLLL